MNSSSGKEHRFRQWMEKRWPLSAVLRWGADEKIPGGAKFTYVLGSATLFLFVVLVITGVWQLLYYVPTVDHAYDSVMYLRLQVPLGWLVHGLHYWAAQAFIVVMGLHLVRVFIWAAYKKPRELTWVIGVVLLLLGAAFIFTGAILPWDTLGYWAGEVGTSMAGTVPLIGTFLKSLMRGGATMDQMTLSRAFVVHVAILPALAFFFIAAHLVAFRQFGSVGPWNSRKRENTGWFWPDQTFKDLLVIALILVALIALSAYVRAPITGPADPLDNSYAPKPEWNFLFLYEALKAFKGPWERVGTVIIPLLLVLLLFAVPFIDRNEKTNPLHRPIAMFCGFLFVAVILALTLIGHYSKPGASTVTGATHGARTANPAFVMANPGPPAEATLAARPVPDPLPAPASDGRPDAHGNPPLRSPHTPGPTPGSDLPPGPAPGPARGPDLNSPLHAPSDPPPDLVPAAVPENRSAPQDPTARTNTAASTVASDVAAGRALFSSARCITCHAIDGLRGGTVGPNLSREALLGRSRQWLITQITDPVKHDPTTVMPAHTALSEPQLNELADFLLHPESIKAAAAAAIPTLPETPELSQDLAEWQARLFPEERQNPVPANITTLASGEAIYQGECLPCHGPRGTGNGPAAIAFLGKVADLAAPTMWAYSDGALFAKVSHGQGSMPAFKSLLTETQRWEVVNYIRTLAPKPAGFHAPKPRPAPPTVPKTTTPAPVARATTNQVATSPPPAPARAQIRTAAPPTNALAAPPVPARVQSATPPPSPNVLRADMEEGRQLFTSARCVVCHKIEGKGGKVGPDLTHEAELGRTRQWLITQILDPAKHDPATIMPAHTTLSEQQLNDLAEYLLHPSGPPSAAAPPSQAATQAAAPPPGSPATHIDEGARLFNSAHCIVCHTVEGMGGKLGPDLSHEKQLGRTRQWLITQILDPFKHNPTTIMYSHKALTEQQLNDLADFLLNPSAGKAALEAAVGKPPPPPAATSLSSESKPPPIGEQGPPGPAVKMVGDPKHGKILFERDCQKCHGPNGAGGVPNPGSTLGQVPPLAPIARSVFSKEPQVFAENLDRFIQHGATPPGPAPALHMPAFGATRALTQPEIANIEAYLMSRNGVDRAKIIHPGIPTGHFLLGTIAVFGLALLVIGGLRAWSSPWGGHPTPEEYQSLKHEVEDLKHKLEGNRERKPPDTSENTSS